jgi:hypothetical protein
MQHPAASHADHSTTIRYMPIAGPPVAGPPRHLRRRGVRRRRRTLNGHPRPLEHEPLTRRGVRNPDSAVIGRVGRRRHRALRPVQRAEPPEEEMERRSRRYGRVEHAPTCQCGAIRGSMRSAVASFGSQSRSAERRRGESSTSLSSPADPLLIRSLNRLQVMPLASTIRSKACYVTRLAGYASTEASAECEVPSCAERCLIGQRILHGSRSCEDRRA